MRYVYNPKALIEKYKGSIIICDGKDVNLHEDKLYIVNDVHNCNGEFVVIVDEVTIINKYIK